MTKASDALEAWIEECSAITDPEQPFPSLETADLVSGFGRLGEDQQWRLLELEEQSHSLPASRYQLVQALGSSRSAEALEKQLGRFWSTRPAQYNWWADLLLEAAFAHGWAKKAAQLVVRLRRFSSMPGLVPKMRQIIDEFALDDAQLDDIAGVFTRSLSQRPAGQSTSVYNLLLNTMQYAPLSIILIDSGKDELLEPVRALAFTFLEDLDDRSTASSALYLSHYIEDFAQTAKAAGLCQQIRAELIAQGWDRTALDGWR